MKRLASGFTMVELVVIMIVIGVLAVAVAPRFLGTQAFEARGFRDETLSLLRYAQKTAIAQRRTVCVAVNPTGLALTIDTDTPPDGACNSALVLSSVPRGGSGLSASVAGFNFTALGATDQAANVNLSVAGSGGIVVEADTGYVHE